MPPRRPQRPSRRTPVAAAQALDTEPVLDFIRHIWAVDHELQRVSKRMMGRIGVTAPQRLAVRFIGRFPGLTFGELADLLHLHAGTVTGIVRHLEGLGLVEQTRSAEDTRRWHLALTPRGRQFDRRRKGTVESAVRRTAAAMTAAELAAGLRVMNLLARNLAEE